MARSIIRRSLDYGTEVHAVADAEIRKLRHDPSELATRAIQPAIWLVLFGEVMAQVRGLATGDQRYLDFLAPGILAQSVLFAAIFYGIGAIWEKDLGVLHRYLVSPAPRSALVMGKAISAGVRGLSQAGIVYVLSALLGVGIDWHPLAILGAALFILAASGLFATFSLIVACLVKTRERFMGIGQVMTMPLFFASNAIYPVSQMPGWLRVFARLNPLTYVVDGLRCLMLAGGRTEYGLGLDAAVLIGLGAVLTAIAARMYPRMTA